MRKWKSKPTKEEKRERSKTRENQRRIARKYARRGQGKKPLAEPLTIAPTAERNAAAKQGKMVFYDGGRRIELPLADRKNLNLVGVYRVGERLLTLREGGRMINLFELEKSGPVFLEKPAHQSGFREAFFLASYDLGHMELPQNLRGCGLGLKAASKAERHVRSGTGIHRFGVLKKFKPLFERLGYQDKGTFTRFKEEHHLMEKSGKFNPKDDLSKWRAIEAIDPKNGKARMFIFPIEKK